MAHINDLPNEVLLEILRELYGARLPRHMIPRFNELVNVAKVCQAWYDVAFQVYGERCAKIGISEQRFIRLWKSSMGESTWLYQNAMSLNEAESIGEVLL